MTLFTQKMVLCAQCNASRLFFQRDDNAFASLPPGWTRHVHDGEARDLCPDCDQFDLGKTAEKPDFKE